MMKEPVDHILRPHLPWRQDGGMVTECGYNATKVKTLTREEFFERKKTLGSQRTAMITCMTCADTASRWGTWDSDPRAALQREIIWECGHGYSGVYGGRDDRGQQLQDELVAIADLIATHRDKFDDLVRQTGQRRAWLEKKAELTRRPKATRPTGIL